MAGAKRKLSSGLGVAYPGLLVDEHASLVRIAEPGMVVESSDHRADSGTL